MTLPRLSSVPTTPSPIAAALATALTRAEQNARTHLVCSALLAAKEWVSRFEIDDYERTAAQLADVLIGG